MLNLLCFLTLFFSLNFLSIPASSNLSEFVYDGFNQLTRNNISLSGAAEIKEHGILRLTNDAKRVMGHALFPSPIQFKNSSNSSVISFSTCFAFRIVPEFHGLGGHGFAFTIAPSKDFFDSLISNKTLTPFYFDNSQGETAVINLKSGKSIMAWIHYNSTENLLSVGLSKIFLDPQYQSASYQLDLSPILEKNMYVGFSASTGLLASSHYVMGWSFKVGGEARSLNIDTLPSFPAPRNKRSVLIIFVMIFFSIWLNWFNMFGHFHN